MVVGNLGIGTKLGVGSRGNSGGETGTLALQQPLVSSNAMNQIGQSSFFRFGDTFGLL